MGDRSSDDRKKAVASKVKRKLAVDNCQTTFHWKLIDGIKKNQKKNKNTNTLNNDTLPIE